MALEEIEVVCVNCSFPTVTEYDDSGKVAAFREEEAPKTEEEALAAGWTDCGLGLNCPKCSASAAKEQALADEQGVESGASLNRAKEAREAAEQTTYFGMLRAIHPEVSIETIGMFSELLRAYESGGRGASTPEEIEKFVAWMAPKTEKQAAEYLAVAETVKKAMVKR
jgi:hypothetical protein